MLFSIPFFILFTINSSVVKLFRMQDKMITMSYKGIVIMFYLIYLQTYIHC